MRQVEYAFRATYADRKSSLEQAMGRLEALSPMKILKRGYSLSFNHKDELVKKVKDVKTGEQIRVRLIDGELFSEVKKIKSF